VHEWKYGEGEGEEEVEKRRKMERERKKKRPAPPPPFNSILHPPLVGDRFKHLSSSKLEYTRRTQHFNTKRWPLLHAQGIIIRKAL
jgi:hypothetical protein